MKYVKLSSIVFKAGLLATLVTGPVSGVLAKSPEQYPENNTGRNSRDADGDTTTPGDQGRTAHDRKLIQSVRKSIVSDDALSMNAKNVKIISIDGKLTLRGPVNSATEKDLIRNKASDIAGMVNVDDQLEVISK